MGSVKDLKVIKSPSEDRLGEGIFEFSDRYSVFDWGEMPDHIPYKGAALCMMAAWNFEQLQKQGVPTHYLGVLNGAGYLDKLKGPASAMAVSLSRVIEPSFVDGRYDYSYFINGRGRINNFVVPLEIIYRNGAPQGSSLLKTISELEASGDSEKLNSLLQKYGLATKPVPGQLFPKTGYDFTTKFEPTDRKVSDEEALIISGLTEDRFKQLREIRTEAVELVSRRAREVGMIDFDGKHEYRIFDGVVSIADVFGTLDENRFMIPLNGQLVQVSKEFLRQYHKKHQKDWFETTERAKARGVEDWTTLCTVQPKNLDPNLVSLVGEMYAAASNRYTGLSLFRNARSLGKVMEDILPFLN